MYIENDTAYASWCTAWLFVLLVFGIGIVTGWIIKPAAKCDCARAIQRFEIKRQLDIYDGTAFNKAAEQDERL